MSTITTKDGTQIRNGCIGDRSQFYKDIARAHSSVPTGPVPRFRKA